MHAGSTEQASGLLLASYYVFETHCLHSEMQKFHRQISLSSAPAKLEKLAPLASRPGAQASPTARPARPEGEPLGGTVLVTTFCSVVWGSLPHSLYPLKGFWEHRPVTGPRVLTEVRAGPRKGQGAAPGDSGDSPQNPGLFFV